MEGKSNDRQTDRWTDGQTDRRGDGGTDRQKQTDRHLISLFESNILHFVHTCQQTWTYI
jgi:hypothetical protein